MTSPYQKAYHKIKARREEVKPQPVWGSWGRFYDRLFNLQGKLVLDFGSDVEAPLYKKFQRENEGKDGKYKGYDISEDAISWLKGQGYYYDFYADNSLLGSFDIIIASEVYEHLTEAERERFLSRAHELLSRSGSLILDVPYISNLNLIVFFKSDSSTNQIALQYAVEYIVYMSFTVHIYI